jgi:hypothetical protein
MFFEIFPHFCVPIDLQFFVFLGQIFFWLSIISFKGIFYIFYVQIFYIHSTVGTSFHPNVVLHPNAAADLIFVWLFGTHMQK